MAIPPCRQRERRALRETATGVNKGHGRVEPRTLTSTTLLNEYLDWPEVGQVFQVERERRVGDEVGTETAYGITSLPRSQADASRLLAISRAHWRIENSLHYMRDVTFGEDACRVRKGSGPQILAALRNGAVHLLKQQSFPSLAAAVRRYAAKPFEALALITGEN